MTEQTNGRISAEARAELARMSQGHMVPVIDFGDAWEVETDRGETFIVPADLVSIPAADRFDDGRTIEADDDPPEQDLEILEALAEYMPEGCVGRVERATVRRNVFLCHMSAPGYSDCTDWEAHKTAQDAADSLIVNYGD